MIITGPDGPQLNGAVLMQALRQATEVKLPVLGQAPPVPATDGPDPAVRSVLNVMQHALVESIRVAGPLEDVVRVAVEQLVARAAAVRQPAGSTTLSAGPAVPAPTAPPGAPALPGTPPTPAPPIPATGPGAPAATVPPGAQPGIAPAGLPAPAVPPGAQPGTAPTGLPAPAVPPGAPAPPAQTLPGAPSAAVPAPVAQPGTSTPAAQSGTPTPGAPAPGAPAPGAPAPGAPAPGAQPGAQAPAATAPVAATAPPATPSSAAQQPASGAPTAPPQQPPPGAPAPGTRPTGQAPSPLLTLPTSPTLVPAGPGGPLPVGLPTLPTAPVPPTLVVTPAPVLADLQRLLGVDPAFQREQLGQAVGWLVENLDRPYTVATGCAQLGSALSTLGVPAQRLEMLAMLMVDAMRAGLGPGATPQQHAAWQKAGELVSRWITQGMEPPMLEPAFWTGVVTDHRRPAPHLAVITIRTYLPYAYLAGQYATVETNQHPQDWRRYWIGSSPNRNNRIELHVRRTEADDVATALVAYTEPGDTVRLHLSGGAGAPAPSAEPRPLLVLAEDIAIAPARAVVSQLRGYDDQRPIHLYWGVPTEDDLYDLASVLELADDETFVVPAVLNNSNHVGDDDRHVHGRLPDVAVAYGDWSGHDVLVYGSSEMALRCEEMLAGAGVPTEQITMRTLDGPEVPTPS